MGSMKNDIEMHEHPNKGEPRMGCYTIVYGRRLEAGDLLEPGDKYASSSGYWEECTCPGLVLGAGTVPWVRPA